MPQPEESIGNADRPARSLPSEIGGYRIQRVLGTGGMATVYAALQKQPRRTVAVKVMRSAADADVALRRFRREIEILGRLRHPYIAQVYDAGVHHDAGGSAPFFVMEYVPRAKTIVEFAEQHDLSIRDRLKLMVKVCAAVEHGHQRKIIHRDLKPSNVLIDEQGEPRIIDFGVARAMAVDLGAETLQTEEGRLVGTMQYMAPEQLESAPQDLDPRCDVYGLGVVLYRLLTGRPPYNLQGLPIFTAAQIVRDDAPPRPGALVPHLRGDLETIILKALAKDPQRRYPTAGRLGRDVLRYLASKPVHAKKASAAHRVRLFCRRRRVELIAAAIVMLILVAAVFTVLTQRASLTETGAPGAEAPLPVAGADVTAVPGGPKPAARSEETTGGTEALALAGGGDEARRAGARWNLAPEPFTLRDVTQAITALCFDPGGARLAGGAEDPAVALWGLENGQALFIAADHDAPVRHVAFAAEGELLVSAADDSRLVSIETSTGRIHDVAAHPCDRIIAMAVDAGGRRVALGCDDLTLRLIDLDGEGRHVLRGTSGAFQCAAFSHDGSLLAAGTVIGDVYLWDPATGELIERFDALREPVLTVAFDAGDRHLIGITEAGGGIRWDIVHEAPEDEPFTAGIGNLVDACVDPTGRGLACASTRHVVVIDLAEGAPAGGPLRNAGEIRAIALSPGMRWLAIGEDEGVVRVVPLPGLESDAPVAP